MNEEIIVQGTENVEPTTEEMEVQVETVEQPTDESAKIYTEEEFRQRVKDSVDKKMSRREAKIRKEYERKYGDLESVLRAGSGKETVEEMTEAFTQFYKDSGVDIPKRPQYNSNDLMVLARAEADEIIKAGFDEVIEETDRLANIGVDKMNEREKEVFRTLAEYRQSEERGNALEKLGVTKDVYTSQEFKDFANMFNATTPVTEIINLYNAKTKPQKQIQTAGSMKTTEVENNGIKDFYTYEESLKYTKEDFDKNPKLWDAMLKSMTKWGK